ncbi:MAG: HD-GYP domain-containing protein, partial [bacterium]
MVTRLDGLVLVRSGEPPLSLWGRVDVPIQPLHHEQVAHLATGRAVLLVSPNDSQPVVLMARSLNPSQPEQAVLWGQIRLSTLSSDLHGEGDQSRLDVLANRDSVEVLGAGAETGVAPPGLRLTGGSGELLWNPNGKPYLAGYWTAFLGYEWNASSWTVVLSQPMEDVFAPMQDFSRTFLLVVCIALVLVFLLSNIQIRRQMRPLVELKKGTLRVAQGEFTHRVDLKTGDEFEALAGSFNSMADRLGEQFSALTVANERLEHLSWGTLAALARTIDASSPWTAGHSERVTRISLAIGEELGLSRADLDRLHRGGLLHDIGKIGIPHALLDKPG